MSVTPGGKRIVEKLDPKAPKFKKEEHAKRKASHTGAKLKLSRWSIAKQGAMQTKPPLDYGRIIRQYPGTTPLYGIELEIERKPANSILEIAVDLLGGGFVCGDGSLRDDGIEIVTQPRSENEIRESYGQCRKALEVLSAYGARSHDVETCGLHVHVSRHALTRTQWNSLHSFLYEEDEFFRDLSRRKTFQYCEFYADPNEARYSALNLSPHDTAEFRFFRGTLNPFSYIASLECIFALVNYVKFCEGAKPSLHAFKTFVKTSRYPYLAKYIFKLEQPEKGKRPATEEELVRIARRLVRVVSDSLEDHYYLGAGEDDISESYSYRFPIRLSPHSEWSERQIQALTPLPGHNHVTVSCRCTGQRRSNAGSRQLMIELTKQNVDGDVRYTTELVYV